MYPLSRNDSNALMVVVIPPNLASPTSIMGRRKDRYMSACNVLDGPGDRTPPAVSTRENFCFGSSVADDEKKVISLSRFLRISESGGGFMLSSSTARWGEVGVVQ